MPEGVLKQGIFARGGQEAGRQSDWVLFDRWASSKNTVGHSGKQAGRQVSYDILEEHNHKSICHILTCHTWCLWDAKMD